MRGPPGELTAGGIGVLGPLQRLQPGPGGIGQLGRISGALLPRQEEQAIGLGAFDRVAGDGAGQVTQVVTEAGPRGDRVIHGAGTGGVAVGQVLGENGKCLHLGHQGSGGFEDPLDRVLAQAALIDQAAEVTGRVHRSIIAFQFYDKLSQRLAHVSHSLEALGCLVTDQRKIYSPFEWVGLQEKIRAKYSTREEVDMFNAVMQGMPVKEALENYKAEMKDKGDDVELF